MPAPDPRPLVIVDTSVLVQAALRPEHRGAAQQLLLLLPAIARVVMSDQIVDEVVETFTSKFGWTGEQVWERYGAFFREATFVKPADERADHAAFVQGDVDDTILVRTAEGLFTDAPWLLGAPQHFIVSSNTRHLVPGSAYAGFLVVTPHDLLARLEALGA